MPNHVRKGFTTVYENVDEPDGVGTISRLTSVEGPLARRAKKRFRPGAPHPLNGSTAQYLRDSGEDDLALIGYENGHLIALDLGGPNDNYNVAPMFSYFNQVTYRQVETDVHADDSITHLRVEVSYRDDLPAIPNRFVVYKKTATQSHFEVFRRLAMNTEVAKPYALPHPSWRVIKNIIAENLPNPKPDSAPYTFMDALRPELGLGQPQNTTLFTPEEKTCIYIANSLYSKRACGTAFLMSDLPVEEDSFQTLVRMGGSNRPQVDHILPRSWGGSNSFANAQLVSLRANKEKLAQVTDDQRATALAQKRKMPDRGDPAKIPKYV